MLASEYIAGDDFSAMGRLWRAVKDEEGCPKYEKFVRWVSHANHATAFLAWVIQLNDVLISGMTF